ERGTLCPPAPLPAGMQCRIRPLPARAAALRRLFHSKNPPWPHVWPGLAVVSCWASAGADRFLPALQERLPGVTIQGKGLLATEGAVTIPLYGLPGAAPALTSHFLEFLSEADPGAPPRLVDELEAGATYQVVLSTGGGLYRYRLEDRVGVVGFHGPTPLLEFLGKVGAVSDLCGEKLHEYYVAQVFGELSRVLGLRPTFTMLAPEWGEPPRYLLLVEGLTPVERDRFADRCELALRQCYHYDYCRRLGQLGPVEAVAVRDAARRYLDRCASLGQRAGDVKPVALHRETGWRDYFRGSAGGP
ncbi:MAG: GH3 auxin-responsive promoter family protein, partial [Armatimonadetes bacterium]|nr:GH3 auxin-responsive promoter family protein [Armatimonadota bacterium]